MNFTTYADIKRDEHFHEKYLRVDESMVDSSDDFNTFFNENIDRMTAVLAHDDAKKVKQSRATSVAPPHADESSSSRLSASDGRPTRTSIQSVGGHRASGSISSAAGPSEGVPGIATGQAPFSSVLEHDLYQPLMKILTRVSIHVARKRGIRNDGLCILFQSSHSHPLDDGMGNKKKYHAKKPDLVAVWKPLSKCEALIGEATNKAPASQSWKMTEIVSLLEVKLKHAELPNQLGAYASDLPRGRPDIAGLLLMTCTAEVFRFCWSDASRFVHSSQYEWKENVHLLFYFLHTLYDAVDDLPQLDTTIQLPEGGKKQTYLDRQDRRRRIGGGLAVFDTCLGKADMDSSGSLLHHQGPMAGQ
ncbi:hypothetical protein DFH11DRAFT_1235883 [Phellopilus nigrolimitatus]|nr:hypothetical protein DFH11DRAFT_1235883 [Phellopilus nigrolimitatus]